MNKQDIKDWLKGQMNFTQKGNGIVNIDQLTALVEQCFNELAPKSEWVNMNPTWPDPNQKVKAIIKHCKTGEEEEIELDVVNEGDHLFEYEGCELSIAWDVIKWMPLPSPPKANKLEGGE